MLTIKHMLDAQNGNWNNVMTLCGVSSVCRCAFSTECMRFFLLLIFFFFGASCGGIVPWSSASMRINVATAAIVCYLLFRLLLYSFIRIIIFLVFLFFFVFLLVNWVCAVCHLSPSLTHLLAPSLSLLVLLILWRILPLALCQVLKIIRKQHKKNHNNNELEGISRRLLRSQLFCINRTMW